MFMGRELYEIRRRRIGWKRLIRLPPNEALRHAEIPQERPARPARFRSRSCRHARRRHRRGSCDRAISVIVTECDQSRTLSEICGCNLWLKFENLQFTSTFKERGALNRLQALSPDERQRGVIAMSAGNHAQGVAYHAHTGSAFPPRS